MDVKLFVPCFIDLLFPEAGWACVELLERAGCNVHYDERITCCGQPAFNSGYQSEAAKVATRVLSLLSEDDMPVVIPSGSCGSMIQHHYGSLPLENVDLEKWKKLQGRLFEFTQFWVEQLGNPLLSNNRTGSILLHRSCHGLREMKIGQHAETILRGIEGLTIHTTDDRDACCGFGGTFSVKFPELSVTMADVKLKQAIEKKTDAIVANDTSCLMHMKARAEQKNLPLKFLSVAEVMVGTGAIA